MTQEGTPAPATNNDSQEMLKVKTFIKANSGEKGVTAVQIAGALGLSLDGDSKKASLTKVRRLARKVVDTSNGDRTQKEGKEKLYKI
jgi:hypothetical protein